MLFFVASESRYLVLPNGGMWVWAGLRELSTGKWDSQELDRIPARASGGAADIPYVENSTLIDFQGSPRTGDVAFDRVFPSSGYDWETFFHAPLLIATQLSQGQRFAEARLWSHTIFDPTSDRPVPQNVPLEKQEAMRYWRFAPFREAALQDLEVDDLLETYAKGALPAAERARLEANITAWKDQPFSPHLIARSRVRSYMWAVIIKYAQNHLGWADQLYRRDTLESINQATQLYVLVARLLGPRPKTSPRPATPARSYAYLAGPSDGPVVERLAAVGDACAGPELRRLGGKRPDGPEAGGVRRRDRGASIDRHAVLLHSAERQISSRCGTRSRTGCSRSATA